MKKMQIFVFILSFTMILGFTTMDAAAYLTTVVSDSSTLFSASGTNSLSAMDSAVTSNTYPTPNLNVFLGAQGSFTATIPSSTALVISPVYDTTQDGPSGYYQTSFVLPSGFSNASLTLQVAGDDKGYAYLNLNNLGYFTEYTVSTFTTSNPTMFNVGTNLLTFAVSNSGGGPTALTFEADVNYTPVPIPAAVWLLGTGLIGLVGIRRRFKK